MFVGFFIFCFLDLILIIMLTIYSLSPSLSCFFYFVYLPFFFLLLLLFVLLIHNAGDLRVQWVGVGGRWFFMRLWCTVFVLCCCQFSIKQTNQTLWVCSVLDLLRVLLKVDWLQQQAVHRRAERSQSDASVYSTDTKSKRRPAAAAPHRQSGRILHSSDSVNSPWFNVSQPFSFFFSFHPFTELTHSS